MALRYELATYDPVTYLVGDEIVSGTPTFVHADTIYALCSDGYYHSFGANKRVVKNGRYVSDSAVYADNGSGTLLDPLPMTVYQPAVTNRFLLALTIAADYKSDSGGVITLDATTSTRNLTEASHFAANDVNTNHTLETSIIGSTINYYYITRISVKAAEEDWIQLLFDLSGFTADAWINFNANTGAFGNNGGDILNTNVVDLGNGWWDIYIEAQCVSTEATTAVVLFANTNDTDAVVRRLNYVGDNSSGIYLFGCQVYESATTSGFMEQVKNIGPIFTTGTEDSTDEIINTYPSANWSNSEGPIYIEFDYQGIDQNILLNDDVAILYVTSDVLYLDDGTNTTSIACSTVGEHKVGIALDSSGGNMRLNLDGTWAD